MDRRNFLKMTMLSSLGLGLLCKGAPALARGIPARAFPDGGPGRGFVPPTGVIRTPLVDLFKVGPGPSSSHTVAPLRIASNFRQAVAELPAPALARAARIEARLYGSLSATGRGHRTDRAILAGLLGQRPETCDPKIMDSLADPKATFSTTIGGRSFSVSQATLVWDAVEHSFPFSNTLVMRLLDAGGKPLLEREYYSPGGGFFLWKGQPDPGRGEPPHRFGSMAQFRKVAGDTGKPLHQIMLENETAILGVDEKQVYAHLDLVLKTMDDGVDQGLKEEGLLPGPFEFYRKAKRIHDQAKGMSEGDGFMQRISSYAMAVSEGNAAGHLAVTAPTLGSAGTMPALVYVMKRHLKLSQEDMRRGLLAAGLVGLLCKTNASVAGAEVGCQGEIGVASSMAAAMLAYATGASLEATELAATIALEHHLGMSCDPVGGFVLIPCIERNAFGALKAYNAALMAKSEIASQHWEDLDRVIAAMLETGKALPPQFREMGTGGLGVSMVDC
ncbi:MAG: L-serine ammonia-lyase [Proteobacteria bacterium]|nr:L-serine ammonia-lyase [Pseudomonadota bacterium]